MFPYALERTITDIRLKKEGFKVLYEPGYDTVKTILQVVINFIPIVNILNGIRYFKRLIKNKFYYNAYKGQMIIEDRLIKDNDNDLTEDEAYEEMTKLSANLIDELPLSDKDKSDLKSH